MTTTEIQIFSFLEVKPRGKIKSRLVPSQPAILLKKCIQLEKHEIIL